MECSLAQKTCVPCRGGTPALTGHALEQLAGQLGGDWQVVQQHHLDKTFRFKDFLQALAFVNTIGEIAEQQRHHPDIHLAWGLVRVCTHTHKIDGLTESDFVLAAKIDQAAGK